MAILKCNDMRLAVGLSWLEPRSVSANVRESKVQRDIRSLKPAPSGYALIATRDGLQTGITYNSEEINCQSAAAWLAAALPSAIVIEQIDTNSYWLCAVEHGAIFPSGDVVGDRDQIATRLDELQMDAAGTEIPCYDSTGDFESLSHAVKASFLEIVGDSDPDSRGICKSLSARRIKHPKLALAASFSIALAVLGGWHAYQLYMAQAKQAEVANAPGPDSAFVQEKLQVETDLSQNASALLNRFLKSVYRRPVRAGGWRVVSHEWNADKVETVWARNHGDISDLAGHLQTRAWRLDESSGTVTETFGLPAPASEVAPAETRLGGLTERHDFLDTLASIPGRWTLEQARTTGRKFHVNKSVLHGSSNSLKAAIAAAERFGNRPVTLTRIRVDLSDAVSWSLQGEYYESTH